VPGNSTECPSVLLHVQIHTTLVTNNTTITSPDCSSNIFSFLQTQILFQTMKHVYSFTKTKKKKKTPWSESASELHRLSDLRLSTKLVTTFADRGVSRSQRNGSLRPFSRFSRPKPLLLLSSSSSVVLTRLGGPRCRPTACRKIW
jgi:hypothetical protein